MFLEFKPFPYSHVGSEWETWFSPSKQNSILRIVDLKLDSCFNFIQFDQYILNTYMLTSIQESHKSTKDKENQKIILPYTSTYLRTWRIGAMDRSLLKTCGAG